MGIGMRTYSRADWQAANEAWSDFDPLVWDRVRRIAASQGFIYPPTGSVHDDRESEHPSQRAVIYRALEDNPAELEAIVRRSSSWSGVVDRIFALESRLRVDADYREKDAAWEKAEEKATSRERMVAVADVLAAIRDSR